MDTTTAMPAIVELFGRTMLAGMVSQELIAGQGFIRVDVPAVGDQPKFTKFYGPTAIYAITPCDEATMLAGAQGLCQKPIEPWSLNLPKLAAPAEVSHTSFEDEEPVESEYDERED